MEKTTETAAPTTTPKTKPAGSGIKKATGYITPDGKHHPSQAAAVQYLTDSKVKEALASSLSKLYVVGQTHVPDTGVTEDDRGNSVIYADDVAAFLFANRVAILEALTVTVRTRKPGAGRKKASAAA